MTVGDLMGKLMTMPQDKQILCQVVGEDGSAWNVFLDVHDIKESWMVQLRLSHPDLKSLPELPKEG